MTTVLQVIEKAYTKANGEYEAITESGDDFKTGLNILNQVMEQWADTPYVKWQTLFNMNYTLPTPVADTVLIYDIPNMTDIDFGNTPFDHVFFVDGAGVVVDRYKIVDQAMFEATSDIRVCAIVSDGLHMKSTPALLIGTNIRLPAYVRPTVYTSGSQTVVIDSITWLVTSMAAFLADTSPVPFIARNAEKFHKQADVYMKTMRDNNRKRQVLTIKRLDGRGAGMTWNDVLANMTMADLYHG
jgi:hypothetical protein